MMQRTTLVTGGAGFIGSHLVDRLVQEGFRVTVVDNLATGRRENVNRNAAFYCRDINDPHLADVFSEEKPEILFHLAAQASVAHSVKDPAEDARTNILGSLNILEQCLLFGVQRFIYSSTGGALYGEPDELPCAETDQVSPLSPYGASKYAAESYVRYFGLSGGLRYSILRYGNVYGPRQDPDGEAGVIAIFARQMIDGRPVVIYGDGHQERDFVYVADVVDANMKAMEQQQDDVYNIGTGRGTSVNNIFAHLAGLTNYKKRPTYQPAREGDVNRIYLDVRKAEQQLGWVPEVDLETGLALTLDSFRGAGD